MLLDITILLQPLPNLRQNEVTNEMTKKVEIQTVTKMSLKCNFEFAYQVLSQHHLLGQQKTSLLN